MKEHSSDKKALLDMLDMVRHSSNGESAKAAESFKRLLAESKKRDPQFTTLLEDQFSKVSQADTPESKRKTTLEMIELAEEKAKVSSTKESLNDPRLKILSALTHTLKAQLMEPSPAKATAKQPSLIPLEIKKLKASALLNYKNGEYITAIKLFKACLDLYDAQKAIDENSVASTCYNLGAAYWKAKDGPSARVYLSRALEIRQKKGDEEGSNKIKQLMSEIPEAPVVEQKSSQAPSM